MLFGPERDKRGRNIPVHRSKPVDAGMARCAYGDEPPRCVLVRPAMMHVNASWVRIRYSAHLAVPAIALEDFVAVPGEAIPRMAQASQARRAQARRAGIGLPAGTEQRALAWEVGLHRRRLYPITAIIGSKLTIFFECL